MDEKAKERIRELERELESLQQKLGEQEDKSNKMYLHMYSKEQEAGPSTSKVSCSVQSRSEMWKSAWASFRPRWTIILAHRESPFQN